MKGVTDACLIQKKNESIIIEPDIEIEVVAVGRNQIKLGITAPRQVSIYRKEINFSADSLRRPVMLHNFNLHSNKHRYWAEGVNERYALKK